MNFVCAESASFPDHQPSNAGHVSWTTAASAKADSTPFASASSTSAEGTANSTTRVKISTIMVLRHLIRLLRLNYQCNEKKTEQNFAYFLLHLVWLWIFFLHWFSLFAGRRQTLLSFPLPDMTAQPSGVSWHSQEESRISRLSRKSFCSLLARQTKVGNSYYFHSSYFDSYLVNPAPVLSSI